VYYFVDLFPNYSAAKAKFELSFALFDHCEIRGEVAKYLSNDLFRNYSTPKAKFRLDFALF